MIYLVNVKDGLLRYCESCHGARSHYVCVTDTAVIVACGTCDRIHKRVELPALVVPAPAAVRPKD